MSIPNLTKVQVCGIMYLRSTVGLVKRQLVDIITHLRYGLDYYFDVPKRPATLSKATGGREDWSQKRTEHRRRELWGNRPLLIHSSAKTALALLGSIGMEA
jgi:hypothetical protein